MGLKYLLLLMCIHMAYTEIVLNIVAENGKISVNHQHQEEHVIEEDDVDFFKIDSEELKEAVGKHLGKKPDAVYLKNPTPYGDVFKRQGWKQVSRVISVHSSRVRDSSVEKLVLMEKTFKNHMARPMKINTGVTREVHNSLNITWDKNNQYTVSEKFNYGINLSFGSGNSHPFTLVWGEDAEKSQTATVGRSEVETMVPAGKEAKVVLTVNVGHVEVDVEYKIFLQGNVVAFYNNPFNGNKFHGPSIDDVMESGGISNEILQAETLEASFYFNHNLNVSIQ